MGVLTMACLEEDPPQSSAHPCEQLEGELQGQPAWVQRSVRELWEFEELRSWKNVVRQVEAFKTIVKLVSNLSRSVDTTQLHECLQCLYDSELHALERAADGISKAISLLKRYIKEHAFASAVQIAALIKMKAARFRDNFAKIQPKLQKLATETLKLAEKCRKAQNESEKLEGETKERMDWWSHMLQQISLVFGGGVTGAGVAAAVGAPAATVLGSQTLGGFAVAAGLMSAPAAPLGLVLLGAGAGATFVGYALSRDTPGVPTSATSGFYYLLSTAAAILCCLGQRGRQLLKAVLANLWESEIKAHQRARETFACMEDKLRKSAEQFKKTHDCTEDMVKAMDLLCEVSEELREHAEEAVELSQGSKQEELLEESIASLSAQVERLAETSQQAHMAVAHVKEHYAELKQNVILQGTSFLAIDRTPELQMQPSRCPLHFDEMD